MAKALPTVGVLGAFFGAVLVAVLVDAAVFVVIPVALAGSVTLLAQRTPVGAVAGLVVLVLAVLAALGMVGTVTTEDGGSADFGIGEDLGVVLGFAACLALPVGALAVRWAEVEPRWLAIAGAACAGIALLMALLDPAALADNGAVYTLATAAFGLASLAPMVPLLRAPRSEGAAPGEPAALATAEAPLHKAPAKRPAPSKDPSGRRP